MNKRQAKKAYKKKYGHNPPVKSTIDPQGIITQNFERFGELLREMVTEAARAITKGWESVKESIQAMSEEEYKAYLETLKPKARGWADAIRCAGKRRGI